MDSIPCTLMRGGSSKGVFFHAEDLPKDRSILETLLLRVMGSPDPRQIDGLGGADPLTSRVAIISLSKRSDADIDFQFALVHIDDAVVEFRGTCGNMMSGAGPFAIDEGLIEAKEPKTTVRIYDVNTKQIIHAQVPVIANRAATHGDYAISGVPGTGARIDLHFYKPAGTFTGKLMPTGQPRNWLDTSRGKIEVSLIDAVTPAVFCRAADLGLVGSEIDLQSDLLHYLEEIRAKGAELMGLSPSAFIPKIVLVSPASENGTLSARMLTLGRIHKAYAVSCAICTSAAALLDQTIPNEFAHPSKHFVRIAHPSGIIEIGVRLEKGELVEAIVPRTARRLMKGHVYV